MIIKNTEKMKKPNIQATKHVDVPVIIQRQVPTIQQVQKTVEVLQRQHVNKVVDVPAVLQRLEPTRGSTGAVQYHGCPSCCAPPLSKLSRKRW